MTDENDRKNRAIELNQKANQHLDSVHPQIANFCVARGDWAQPGSLS